MKISELFRRLSYGELSNLAISGEGSGTLVAEKHPQIIQHINEGLLRIYTRFPLREKDLIIEQVDHITNYHLRRQFAESYNDCDVSHPYIKDLPCEPFLGDVIRIMAVHDDTGILPLNDTGDSRSVFTPQPDVLQVPNPVTGRPLSVLYQARHEPLRTEVLREGEDILDQVIELPFFLEGALQAFIAGQVFGHMGGQENSIRGQEYLAKADTIILEIEDKNLVNQSASTTQFKFDQRGFA